MALEDALYQTCENGSLEIKRNEIIKKWREHIQNRMNGWLRIQKKTKILYTPLKLYITYI